MKKKSHSGRSFSAYMTLTGQDGVAIINADDENVMLAAKFFGGRKVTFSTKDPSADYSAANIVFDMGRAEFDVVRGGVFAAHIKLSVPGAHNVYNALAAFAAACECGLDGERAAAGISRFTGAHRRMEYKGSFCGASVYDDYGHHPTEVRATLRTMREVGTGRLFCVFQSHTYSRTARLFEDFAAALATADRTVVADIYAARETDTMGVSGERLAAETVKCGGNAVYGGNFEHIVEILKAELREGDTLVVMGAGDIYRIYPMIGLHE